MPPAFDSQSQDSCDAGATQVVIADDHDVMRRGIRSVVECRPGWRVAAEAADGQEALKQIGSIKPDIAILDYSLPALNGVEVTRRCRALSPDTQVIIFTMHDREAIVRDALTAGARGFLLKSDADKHLFAALDALSKKQPYFSGQVNEALLHAYLTSTADIGQGVALTPREREVVQLIAEGHSSKQACQILNLSLKTVDNHRASAMRKLKLGNTAALVRYAIRNNLIVM